MSVLWGNGRLGDREEENLTREGQSKWGTWKRRGEPRRAESLWVLKKRIWVKSNKKLQA